VNIEPFYETSKLRTAEFQRLASRLLLEGEARRATERRRFCIPWPRNLRLPRDFGRQNPTALAR